ncbi:MAG TPA: hypothetical protein VHQ22_11255 [Terriglobales bacterium]|jgi:hypothetical protein|nr:hypothetical protein [Terriglobales bacterium]
MNKLFIVSRLRAQNSKIEASLPLRSFSQNFLFCDPLKSGKSLVRAKGIIPFHLDIIPRSSPLEATALNVSSLRQTVIKPYQLPPIG